MMRTPVDQNELFAAITVQHGRTQQAWSRLMALSQSNDLVTRRQAHAAYREAATALLELQQRHNKSGWPSPWPLDQVAQPLVQNTMVEADLAAALGDGEAATQLRDSVLTVAEAYLGSEELARVRREQAALYASEGRFNEALTALADLRAEFAAAGDVVQAAQTALDEAVVLEWLGDAERALQAITSASQLVQPRLQGRQPGEADTLGALLKEAVSIFSGAGATGQSDEAAALWRISLELTEHEARARKALGELDEAARLWTSVLSGYAKIGPAGPGIEYQLAAVDAERGRYEEAQARIGKIEPDFASGLLRARRMGLRSLQAEVALGLGDPQSALEFAVDGIADLSQFPDDDLQWKLQWRRGRALATLSHPDEALDAYGSAARIVDSLRKAPLGYRLDSTYLESKLPLFDAAIDLAEEQGNGVACAQFIELIKSRALSSALSIPSPTRAARSTLEQQFDEVTRQLDALEYRSYSGAVGAEAHAARAELLTQRVSLMEQIRLRDPRWRGLTEPVPFDPLALAARLVERNQVALTLYRRDQRVVAVLVADGKAEVSSQPLDDSTAATIEQYAKNLLRWEPDPYLLDPVDLGLAAEALVPPSFLERACDADALLVAPHRAMHLLPWAALPYRDQRLFERTAVATLPNLASVIALDGDFASRPLAAVAGAPNYQTLPLLKELPATGEELADLQQLYQGRLIGEPAIGTAATEEAVRALATREDANGAILHVCCHGALTVDEPLNSGLLLSDGKLDAAELAASRVHYAEVVLSACSTGWRPDTAEGIDLRGDDILGLPGALLEAGARAVVVSIPKASDEATRAFMVAYHTRRAAGHTPLFAFRDTQRELLKAGDHEPFTWTGIVCYGTR
jgi:CHAT domain-containing protein